MLNLIFFRNKKLEVHRVGIYICVILNKNFNSYKTEVPISNERVLLQLKMFIILKEKMGVT